MLKKLASYIFSLHKNEVPNYEYMRHTLIEHLKEVSKIILEQSGKKEPEEAILKESWDYEND